MMRMLHPLQNLLRAMTTFALTLAKVLSVTQALLVNMLFSMEMEAPLMDT